MANGLAKLFQGPPGPSPPCGQGEEQFVEENEHCPARPDQYVRAVVREKQLQELERTWVKVGLIY